MSPSDLFALKYALQIGFVIGMFIGIVPFFFGAMKNKIGLGAWGFIGTVIAGTLFGLLGAIPTAAIFIYNIQKGAKKIESK